MLKYKNPWFSLILGVLLLGSFGFSKAQTVTKPTDNTSLNFTYQSLNQPTPQIVTPAAQSNLKGLVVIKILLPPTVVQKMEIYASKYFLGLARHQDTSSETWYLSWDTTNYPDGKYDLLARASITQTQAGGYTIDTFSQKVPVVVLNSTPSPSSGSTTQTGTTSQSSSQTSPQDTTTGQTQTPSQPETPTTSANAPAVGETTTTTTSTPSTTTKPTSQTQSPQVEWKTVTTISFPKVSENQLEKIEYKVNQYKQERLVFSGQARAFSQITLKITSQPIIVTSRADQNGSWEYIFEKPLEPGKHQVTVEIVDPNGEKVKSGPFDFLIARAQASTDNPNGSSLQLIDPSKNMYLYYLLIASGLILLAIFILVILRTVKMKKLN